MEFLKECSCCICIHYINNINIVDQKLMPFYRKKGYFLLMNGGSTFFSVWNQLTFSDKTLYIFSLLNLFVGGKSVALCPKITLQIIHSTEKVY